MPTPDPEERQEVSLKHELCPACEDEFSTAKARVIWLAGSVVAISPLVWLGLVYAAAVQKVELILDERVLLAMLTAFAMIIAFGFKTKR